MRPSEYIAKRNLKRGVSERRYKIFRLTRWDIILLCLFVIAASLMAFIGLGTTSVPSSYWEATDGEDYVGVELNDDNYAFTEKIWFYSGIPKENESFVIKVYENVSNNFETATSLGAVTIYSGEMYRWNEINLQKPISMPYVFIVSVDGNARINELVFTDKYNSIINVKQTFQNSNSKSGIAAFDEQSLFPNFPMDKTAYDSKKPTPSGESNGANFTDANYQTDMIFDEVYHARTAFELINGWDIYEYTHPPLGKEIIALGIQIFGMNPLGWRFMPAIFSVLTVVAVFIFGKMLLKRTSWASIFTILFLCDGLRLSLGRIATLDSIVTFFVLASYIFMYRFFNANYNKEDFDKTSIPFALSGLCFGISVAIKWTGAYAGIGLLVLFIIAVKRRASEYRVARRAIYFNQEVEYNAKGIVGGFKSRTIKLTIIGFGFFILVPVIIYVLSYIPYLKSVEGSLFGVMWQNQFDMFNYHNQLTATHPYQSMWWEWAFSIKPVFMYLGDGSYTNSFARIYSIGNPLMYYLAIISGIYFIVYFVKKYHQREPSVYNSYRYMDNFNSMLFLFIAIGANYLPWTLVSRATFVYHFYQTVPFFLCVIVMVFKEIFDNHNSKMLEVGQFVVTKGMLIIAGLVLLCIVNFGLFFPIYTGIPVSKGFAEIMYSFYI